MSKTTTKVSSLKCECTDQPSRWRLINKADKHRICLTCRAHWFRGKYWSPKRWEDWINS